VDKGNVSVEFLIDNTYQVVSEEYADWGDPNKYERDVLFQGTLPECAAWVTLNEKGCIG
jgi:hypothetical protein